jgi:hypothetical protein
MPTHERNGGYGKAIEERSPQERGNPLFEVDCIAYI